MPPRIEPVRQRGEGGLRSLAEEIGAVAPALDPEPELEDLVALPSTALLLEQEQAYLERWRTPTEPVAEGEASPPSVVPAGLPPLPRGLARQLAWARLRDELQRERPAECRYPGEAERGCLGLGGRYRAYLPDGTPTWRSSTQHSDGSGTVVTEELLGAFCGCADGVRARAEADALKRAVRDARERAKLERFWRQAEIPKKLRQMTLATFEREPKNAEALDAVQAWLAEESDSWLVFSGPNTGIGKTHLAMAALVERGARGDSVLYVTSPELWDRLRDTYERPSEGQEDAPTLEHLLATLQKVDTLLLDDLGAEKWSAWVEEKAFRLINQRALDGRRTLITTNLTVEELSRRVGRRISSRLLGASEVLEMSGPDRRLRRTRPAARSLRLVASD